MSPMIEEKVKAYKELAKKIEELEEQKRNLGAEILQLMPQDTHTLRVAEYQVRRFMRLSIKTSLEEAKALGAARWEEVVDKEKIKELYSTGLNIPSISQIQYVQVSTIKSY